MTTIFILLREIVGGSFHENKAAVLLDIVQFNFDILIFVRSYIE